MGDVKRKLKCSNSYCEHILTDKEWDNLIIKQKSRDLPDGRTVPIPDQVICPICERKQDRDELIEPDL